MLVPSFHCPPRDVTAVQVEVKNGRRHSFARGGGLVQRNRVGQKDEGVSRKKNVFQI